MPSQSGCHPYIMWPILTSTGCRFSTLEPHCVHGRRRSFAANSGNPCRCRSSTDFTSCVTTSFLLREWRRGRVDECFACAVPALESHILRSIAERTGPVLLGADVHEDLGLVVDHVDCSVFLSHLKLGSTVGRLPSRLLASSMCVEDVRVRCFALTLETHEGLQNVSVSKKKKCILARTSLSLSRMLAAV